MTSWKPGEWFDLQLYEPSNQEPVSSAVNIYLLDNDARPVGITRMFPEKVIKPEFTSVQRDGKIILVERAEHGQWQVKRSGCSTCS
jgi:hypothetical protein